MEMAERIAGMGRENAKADSCLKNQKERADGIASSDADGSGFPLTLVGDSSDA